MTGALSGRARYFTHPVKKRLGIAVSTAIGSAGQNFTIAIVWVAARREHDGKLTISSSSRRRWGGGGGECDGHGCALAWSTIDRCCAFMETRNRVNQRQA